MGPWLKASAGALILAASMASGVCAAEGPPVRKAGLWEITLDSNGKTIVVRQCVDDASQAALIAKAKPMIEAKCSKHEGRRQGDVYVQDSVCGMMNMQQTSHSETTQISENEYRTVASTHFDPPLMGKADTTSTRVAKWQGPCAGDLAPGEMLVNGRKITIPAQP